LQRVGDRLCVGYESRDAVSQEYKTPGKSTGRTIFGVGLTTEKEIPARKGASFYGTIEDARYLPLMDLGFEGKGGKCLVLPAAYEGTVPAGYGGASQDLQHHDTAALDPGVVVRG